MDILLPVPDCKVNCLQVRNLLLSCTPKYDPGSVVACGEVGCCRCPNPKSHLVGSLLSLTAAASQQSVISPPSHVWPDWCSGGVKQGLYRGGQKQKRGFLCPGKVLWQRKLLRVIDESKKGPFRDSDPGRGRPISHRGVIPLFSVSYEQRICQVWEISTSCSAISYS